MVSTLVIAALIAALVIVAMTAAVDMILERKLLGAHPDNGERDDELRPAEFGYLVRNGDRNHALLVLAVDLVQRAVKQQQEGAKLRLPELAVYEKQMWTNVKDSVTGWAQKKIEDVHPGDIRKNPLRFIERITWLYNFVTGTLKSMVKDIIADPRQLKRYFTVGGMLRLVADFSTAGYQTIFETELKKNLIERGLIVGEERKSRFAQAYFLASALGFVLSFVALYFLVSPLKLTITAFLIASMLGFLIRLVYEGKSFLPYYSEVLHLLNTLSRTGMRVKLVRFLLKFINGMFLFIIIELAVILLIAAYILFLWVAKKSALDLLLVTAFFSLAQLKVISLAFKGWRLTVEEVATAKGRKLLNHLQKKVSDVSPIDTVKKLLQTEGYDPTFSELIAIYGPEALIILS